MEMENENKRKYIFFKKKVINLEMDLQLYSFLIFDISVKII